MKTKLIQILKEYYNIIMELPLSEHHRYNFQIPQNFDEVLQVLDYLGDRKFNNFVEIGNAHGGSLWVYSNLLCNNMITAIDPSTTPDLRIVSVKLKERFPLFRRIPDFSYNVKVDNIDLLHIDGSHKYEDIKRDVKDWFPRVIKGGIILLHDTIAYDGPKRVVKELREKYKINTTKILSSPLGISIVEK